MIREIKFRAWDKSKQRMYDNPIVYGSHELGECWVNTSIKEAQEYLIFMQYTGLKDKNGKEIYEGDIYNYEGEFGVFESIEDFYYSELSQYRVEKGEIIGNIYENQELLQEGEGNDR